jgi:ankyrin repeat protein
MLAVKHGKAELVELLLENGAGVNLQDTDGSTALMCAVEHETLNIVKLLLARPECDVNIADNVSEKKRHFFFNTKNFVWCFFKGWTNSCEHCNK